MMKRAGITSMLLIGSLVGSEVCRAEADVTEQDLYRVFDEVGIEVDPQVVAAQKLAGILAAVDRRARIVSTNEVMPAGARPAVEAVEVWAEDVAYLDVGDLVKGSGTQIVAAVTSQYRDGATGLILDLRGSGGNDLDALTHIADRFAPADTELYRVRDGSGQVLATYTTATNRSDRLVLPLMVLVNRTTRGASEVLAAVLKGREGVILIGEQTQGHEGLMEMVPLTDEAFLYVATRWVVLDRQGMSIDSGVLPDIAVEETDADVELPVPGKMRVGKPLSAKAQRDRDLMERVAGDALLARATDVLLGLQALGATNALEVVAPPSGRPSSDE